MDRRVLVFAAAAAFVIVIGAATRAGFAPTLAAQTPSTVDFARDVQPIFRQHCVGCHGPSQQMNGLRLDRRRDAMRGGSGGGVVIRPGNGGISALYLKLSGTAFGAQMPPTGALKPEQIAIIKQWIDEGAVWPDAVAGDVEPAPVDPGAARLIDAIRGRNRAAFDRALAADRAAVNRRGPGGSAPLMWAALDGNRDAVGALLDAGADPNATNDTGVSALMWAVPDLPIVSLLLDRGANPNAKSLDGRTPLLRAAGIYGASALVQRLLDAGAKPATTGTTLFGQVSALTEAAAAADPDTIRLLLARGADPSLDGPAPLYFALRGDCAACEDALVPVTPPPLLTVVASLHGPPGGDGRHLKRLIDRGVNLAGKDPEGRTLLMLAANSDRLPLDAVQTLIAKGADLKAQSKLGLTAADYAAMQGDTNVAAALTKAGVSPTAVPPPPAPSRAASAAAAVQRSLPLLQRSDATFWKKSGCVSCHNNTLTAETVAVARTRKLTVDDAVAKRQRETIAAFLETWRERALQGLGIPGDADTVSYILRGLAAEGHPPDLATDAMARFLLDKQGPAGQWFLLAHRPPIESSVIENTASALRALQLYGARHGAATDRAIRRAAEWLAGAKAETTEDLAYRVMGLIWAGSTGAVPDAVRALKAAQRPDGGWAQLASLKSDAYATGQALVALTMSGSVARDDSARRRGVEFLMNTQLADGSWFVRTRALAIQPYFEADFPHGKDQFISAAATNWAARALAMDMPSSRGVQ
jgi:ankyrin repeat protein